MSATFPQEHTISPAFPPSLNFHFNLKNFLLHLFKNMLAFLHMKDMYHLRVFVIIYFEVHCTYPGR